MKTVLSRNACFLLPHKYSSSLRPGSKAFNDENNLSVIFLKV